MGEKRLHGRDLGRTGDPFPICPTTLTQRTRTSDTDMTGWNGFLLLRYIPATHIVFLISHPNLGPTSGRLTFGSCWKPPSCSDGFELFPSCTGLISPDPSSTHLDPACLLQLPVAPTRQLCFTTTKFQHTRTACRHKQRDSTPGRHQTNHPLSSNHSNAFDLPCPPWLSSRQRRQVQAPTRSNRDINSPSLVTVSKPLRPRQRRLSGNLAWNHCLDHASSRRSFTPSSGQFKCFSLLSDLTSLDRPFARPQTCARACRRTAKLRQQ